MYCSRRAHGAVDLGAGSCNRCLVARHWSEAEMANIIPGPVITGETRDGKGSGDHDIAYAWGNARSFLTLRQQALLLIMRGYVLDYRAGTKGGAADGDLPVILTTNSGIFVIKASLS